MRIQISDKTLNKLRIKKGFSQLNLNHMSYGTNELSANICPHCLLKSFDTNDWVNITNIEFNANCSCYLKKVYKTLEAKYLKYKIY